MKYVLQLLPILAFVLLLHCARKPADPCLAAWECKDCTCLFDKLQQHLHDPIKAQQIQECYDKACK
jgi:hypothetical protein